MAGDRAGRSGGGRLSVGDYVRLNRPNGKEGVWKITASLVGVKGQESVYGLTVVDREHPNDEFGLRVTTMYVPTVMLDTLIEHDGEADRGA